jgi:hypothetical protein
MEVVLLIVLLLSNMKNSRLSIKFYPLPAPLTLSQRERGKNSLLPLGEGWG